MASPAAGRSLLGRLSMPARVGFGAAVTVIVAAAYWLFFYSDMATTIESATRQQANLRSTLAQEQQAQASYFADRDEYALRQQRQREFNKVLPADTQAAAFLSSLQQVSNLSGIDLKAWQPVEEQPQAFFAKVPMKLELSGKFHQLVKFVHEVGKLDRIINVENIELFDAKTVGEDVVLKARCLATAFHSSSSKDAAQPGTPK